MALLLLLAFLLVPATLATTFHRIETIPLDREVENNLVSEEQDEKGGEIDAGFFLPYRKFTDTPGKVRSLSFRPLMGYPTPPFPRAQPSTAPRLQTFLADFF